MRFKTTRWSLIVAARGDDEGARQEALQSLCEAYWYPLYAFVRSRGVPPDRAEDLTQGYFAALFERGLLDRPEPGVGRFRTYLLTTLKHFLINEAERAAAEKRGGGRPAVSLDVEEAERRYRREPVDRLTPEQVFERRWALSVLERVLLKLREEARSNGREDRYERLKTCITGDAGRSYAAIAADLEMTEGAVRTAVHRLRKRFGRLLFDEIADTVPRAEDVEGEVRHLLGVVTPWSRGGP